MRPENVPELLLRWPEMKESLLLADHRRVEERSPEWNGRLTGVLDEGPPPGFGERTALGRGWS